MASEEVLSSKEKQVLDSQRELLWLKRQIHQYEEEDKAEKAVIPEEASRADIIDTMPLYRAHINEMRGELDILTQYNNSKETLLEALNESHYAIKALYPERSDHHDMEIKKLTQDLIDQRDELVLQFFLVQKELEARKNELTKLQHQVLQQHETNRGHMEKIKELKEIQLDPARRGQVEELKQS